MKSLFRIAMFAIPVCFCTSAQAMYQCDFSCVSEVLRLQPPPGQNEVRLTYNDCDLTHLNRELDWINGHYYHDVAIDYPQILNGYWDGSLKQQLYYAERDHTKQVVIPNWMMTQLSEMSKKYNEARDGKQSRDLYIREVPFVFGDCIYFIDKYGARRAEILQVMNNIIYYATPFFSEISRYYSLRSFFNWNAGERAHNLSELISSLRSNYKDGCLIRLIELAQTQPGSPTVTISKENINFEALYGELLQIIKKNGNRVYLYPNIFAEDYRDSVISQLDEILHPIPEEDENGVIKQPEDDGKTNKQLILSREILNELGNMVTNRILVDSVN